MKKEPMNPELRRELKEQKKRDRLKRYESLRKTFRCDRCKFEFQSITWFTDKRGPFSWCVKCGKDSPIQVQKVKCKNCKREFEAKRSNSLFCSPSCYHKLRYSEENNAK